MSFSKIFSNSLRHRLVLYFTLFTIVPLSVAGTLIYKFSDAKLYDNSLKLAAQIVEKDGSSVDKALADMGFAMKVVMADKSVQAACALPRNTEEEMEQSAFEIGKRLKEINNLYEYLNGIYIVLDDGTIGKSRYYSLREEILVDQAEYFNIRNNSSFKWYKMDQGSMIVNNMGDPVLSMAASLTDRQSGQPCGIVVIEMRQSYLDRLIQADFGSKGAIFLTDSKDILLYAMDSNRDTIDAVLEKTNHFTIGLKSEIIEHPDYFLICKRISATGWNLIGVVQKATLQNDSQKILVVFILTALGSFIMNILVSHYLSNFELRPINEIREYIYLVKQGRFGLPLRARRLDEIGALAASVQEMSGRIGHLIETVKQEQGRLRIAELKALQAQINPHFLYNSLESINWLARKGDTQKTTAMISALTTFFRIGLAKGDDQITLREELEHARSYLVIQKIRYEDQFEYAIYADPAAESFIVPKLIIQPLIENALYHGIKTCERMCMLIIQVISSGEHLEIEVLDNGAGMSEETLHMLRDAVEHKGENPIKSYGLVNVNDRIRILTGTEYGLRFTSELGIGTSVRIVLPKTPKGV